MGRERLSTDGPTALSARCETAWKEKLLLRFTSHRHEPNRQGRLEHQNAILFLENFQGLDLKFCAQGNYHFPTLFELIDERLRNVVRCSRYHDGVERRFLRPAPIAISGPHENVSAARAF